MLSSFDQFIAMKNVGGWSSSLSNDYLVVRAKGLTSMIIPTNLIGMVVS